jgi:alanine dehydrogenase
MSRESTMKPIYIDYLNAFDIEALALTDAEILSAIETSLRAQGNGETVIEPRVHLEPDATFNGHFNVLRGYVAPLNLAGVKIVGDFVDNYKRTTLLSSACLICSIPVPVCPGLFSMPPQLPTCVQER